MEFTGTFAHAEEKSGILTVPAGQEAAVTLTRATTLTGSIRLERLNDSNGIVETLATYAQDADVDTTWRNQSDRAVRVRLRCVAIDDDPGSETVDFTLGDAAGEVLQGLVGPDGEVWVELLDGGVRFPGDLDVDGGLNVDGAAVIDGELNVGAVIDGAQGANIASASTVNLETATGNLVDVTGTTTITAITLSQGHIRLVRFTGILTLTHGASLVLPGAANITTAAGDFAIFAGYASGVVRCLHYLRAASMPATQGGTETLTNKTLTAPTVDTLKCTGGVGAKNGATVSVIEQGDGNIHKTILTLAATPLPIVSVGSANGVGGVKLYDFPEGRVCILGTMADLSLAVAAGKQADFTDATPEGDVGIGTVAPANADAFGTDATDDDFATGTAFTMSAYAATAKCPSEAVQQMDGTATAKDLYLNGLVDAADIDDDVSTEIEVTGTVTVVWVNLGDF